MSEACYLGSAVTLLVATRLTRAQRRVITACVEQGLIAPKGSDLSTLRVLELMGLVARNDTRPQRFFPTKTGEEWAASWSRHGETAKSDQNMIELVRF